MKILLGISGASGAIYGVRAGREILASGAELHLLVTKTAWKIMAAELPDRPPPASLPARGRWIAALLSARPGLCRLHAEDDFRIPFASGSNPPDAVIIAPCSMGMLGRIAHGISSSVLERCADVALKERRPLLLVPRETPLTSIHLENMLALSRAGAEIFPACPGFYHRPGSVEEMVDFVVSRVLSRLGIETALRAKWSENPSAMVEAGDSSSEAPVDEEEEKAPGRVPTGRRGGRATMQRSKDSKGMERRRPAKREVVR